MSDLETAVDINNPSTGAITSVVPTGAVKETPLLDFELDPLINQSQAETNRLNNYAADSTSKSVKETLEKTNNKTVAVTPGQKTSAPKLTNVLHNYLNYTYRLSLHMASTEEFNKLVKNPSDYKPLNVLIASGGAFPNARAPAFKEDFYFENFSLTTIIGLNFRSRESNAIDMSFTIFEPYGCSLLDRLIEVTKTLVKSNNEDNYLVMPYILQIDFLGYDEAGSPVAIPDTTKRIPLKFIEMKIKPDMSGTRYNIRAIPYNHQAYATSMSAIPANFEITASTVRELFSAPGQYAWTADLEFNINQNDTEAKKAAIAIKNELDKQLGPATDADSKRQRELKGEAAADRELAKTGQSVFKVSSLGEALNKWQEFLKKKNLIGEPDKYAFIFEEDDIGNSKPIIPAKVEFKSTPTASKEDMSKNEAAVKAAQSAITNQIFTSVENQSLFRVNAGTNIVNLLSIIISNSEYIRNQIKDNEKPKDTNIDGAAEDNTATEKKLSWFKITPIIKLGKFDRIRNEFSKEITYTIKKYTETNVKIPSAPQGKATDEDAIKEYNYWYTGKNVDVVNVDINFDTMFYTTISTLPTQAKDETNSSPQFLSNEDADQYFINSQIYPKTGIPFPNFQKPAALVSDINSSQYGSRDDKGMIIGDLTQSLMSRSRGDNLHLTLEIIGDPAFIKQDDLLYNKKSDTGVLTENKSIATDDGSVIVRLNFKLADDWTRDTGLLTPSKRAVFDGLYKVLKVESFFERGTFKQRLEMIRLYDQEQDSKKSEQPNKNRSVIGKLTSAVSKIEKAADTIEKIDEVVALAVEVAPILIV